MKKKAFVFTAIIACLIVACAVTGYILFSANYVKIGDKYFSVSVTAADLRGSGVQDISALGRLTYLETADASGEAVKALPALAECASLRSLRVSGSDFPAKDCIAFYTAHPNAELECGVLAGGAGFGSSDRRVNLPDNMSDGDIRLLAALRKLESLDLSRSDVSDATCDFLKKHLPECEIIRRLSFDGMEYLSSDKSVKLSAGFFDGGWKEEAARLKYFNSLEEIDAADCPDSEQLLGLKESLPEVRVIWNTSVFGAKVSTGDESVKLNGQKHTLQEFTDEFDQKLRRFHSLKKVYMFNCGLNNDSMDKLIERYPDVKFVWNIGFMGYTVRTDAVAFSTLIKSKAVGRKLNDKTMEPLFKYCTELVSLDIGHCNFRDISCLANLKNLRALILTDNFVTDISPLAGLEKLEFLELNDNDIESAEPLRNLGNIRMVNLYKSEKITDLSPLYNHERLEMAIFDNDVPEDEQNRFTQSNPGCTTFFKVDHDQFRTTNQEWRDAPLREKFKNSFRKWKNVIGFDEETETFRYNFQK